MIPHPSVPELMARVHRMAGTYRCCVADEMEDAGNLALAECLVRYDASRGEFWPWAAMRIRWAMVDTVRRWTQMPRDGSPPLRVLSLDEPCFADSEHTLADTLPAPVRDIDAELDMIVALTQLRPKRRTAFLRRALLGEYLAEIGAGLGVSESRASQLLAAARCDLQALTA